MIFPSKQDTKSALQCKGALMIIGKISKRSPFPGARMSGIVMRFVWPRALVATLLSGVPLLAAAGTWQTLKNPPPIPEIIDPSGTDFGPGGASTPLLLTDGSVLIQNAGLSG